jgi:hypothetical protein
VQHEGEAFCRRQPVEHHEQREPDGIREERFMLGIAPALARRNWFRHVRGE